MSHFVNHIDVMLSNPFILSPLLSYYFRNTRQSPRNLLSSYLVLPLVLSPGSRLFLANASKTTVMRTFVQHRDFILDLENRMRATKELTNLCLQNECDNKRLHIDDDLSVRAIDELHIPYLGPAKSDRAAMRLGRIFSPYEVPMIYRFLGIKNA